MDIEKRCTCCGLMLPLSEFYRARNGKFGRKAACKECDNLYERAARKRGESDSRRQRFHKMWVRLGLPVSDERNGA
jgi:hypothetical protein